MDLKSYNFLWLSLALFPLLALTFMLSVPAQDYWWYLRLGKDILEQGAIPAIDTMSHSRAGEPIFYQQWLSGIIFYWVYLIGDASLTFLLRAILIGITYGLIWFLMRTWSGARTVTLLLLILGLSTSNNWMIRPQLFAYPLFLLCLIAIYQWQEKNNKPLFLIPLSVLLWVNVHGSFILPFVLVSGAFVFGNGSRKEMGFTIVAMLVTNLLNSHHVGVWEYLIFILNNPSDYLFSVEWYPPTNEGWQMNIFFVWLLVFPIIAGISKNKLSLFEWILFLCFGWLALSGIRYVIWFMFLLAIFTSKLIANWSHQWIDKPIEKINPRLNTILGFVLLSLPLLLTPIIRDLWWKDAPPLYELSTTPIQAVEFLKSQEMLPNSLWNDYAFGSYIQFMLPSHPTWMDTRMYSFSVEQWQEYVQVTNAEGWQEFFDKADINLLFLSQSAQPKLIQAVSGSHIWC